MSQTLILNQKRWLLRDNFIRNEEGVIVLIVPEDVSDIDAKIAESAPQMANAMLEFINDVNSGTLKPRSAVKKFEDVLKQANLYE